MKVLLVEDDAETAAFIVDGLTRSGLVVDHAATGRDGLFLAGDGAYDVIVVDRLLPGMDGLNVVRLLRAAEVKTPVLFLTALGGLDDRVNGLDAGGDDYLVKPFAFTELLARLRALGRRGSPTQPGGMLRVGDLTLDRLSRRVERGGVVLDLLPREFQILEHLLLHAGEVVTRTMLLERVWNYHFDPKSSVVETHVSRLRAKLDKPFATELIRTIRGVGYTVDIAR